MRCSYALLLFSFFPALFIQACTATNSDVWNGDPVTVELSVELVRQDGRQVPVFFVLVKNKSNSPIRIIDLQSREDLQHGYCPVDIYPLDRSFEFGVFISDPGYVDDGSLISLLPGELIRFRLSQQPIAYQDFVPGKYGAVLLCRIEADRVGKIYASTEVQFAIYE